MYVKREKEVQLQLILLLYHHTLSFHLQDSMVAGVLTEEGDAVYAEHVVLAAATQTPMLAAQAGVYVPVAPIKGYSITLPMHGAGNEVHSVSGVIDSPHLLGGASVTEGADSNECGQAEANRGQRKRFSLLSSWPSPGGLPPHTCVIDSAADSHVYTTPLGARLRVAGLVELAGHDTSVNPITVNYLRHIACTLYPDVARANR